MVSKVLPENPRHPQPVSSSCTASAGAMLLQNGQRGVGRRLLDAAFVLTGL